MARPGEALWQAPQNTPQDRQRTLQTSAWTTGPTDSKTMRRNPASALFRPSRRAPHGGRTVELPPHCPLPSHDAASFGSTRAGSWKFRCAAGCLPKAATPSPAANSGALGERDLFRGSLMSPRRSSRFCRRFSATAPRWRRHRQRQGHGDHDPQPQQLVCCPASKWVLVARPFGLPARTPEYRAFEADGSSPSAARPTFRTPPATGPCR